MYDAVFITHLPAFYKDQLYREIAQQKKICVVFLGSGSTERNNDFVKNDFPFDTYYLSYDAFEKRNRFASCWRLLNFLRVTRYKKILVGGWETPEFWCAAVASGSSKTAIVLETSIFNSNHSFLHHCVKRLFCKFVSSAFVAGRPHALLLNALNFRGEIHTTRGVGLMHYPASYLHPRERAVNFLFIGRLVREKSLELLLSAFSQAPNLHLTIVGDGPLMEKLREKASPNVKFVGYVNNRDLNAFFDSHDAFILPSNSETWGLVVEEAIAFGLPVIVSNVVGCSYDLVLTTGAGILFQSGNTEDLVKALLTLNNAKFYQQYSAAVRHFDIRQKDTKQIETYLDNL